MCGIVGWVDWKRDLSREANTVFDMTRTLTRRGPDDEGIWTAEQVAFGHRSAAADLLPQSVIHRKKVPYPTTRSTAYGALLRRQLAQRLVEPIGDLGEIFDVQRLEQAALHGENGPFISNVGAELALNFDAWLRIYRPTFAV
ncbi:asparagine synthase-related protein [Rhodomicrobium lacus]|uniref:asparagine synthase-related protein n=1 Tax=Rhodomicrobium lacus TaxID=2498452 RepID=UPI0026E46F15|nr:asparagine synthase-related protein [Rhodomicrobium lacus]WKW51659.1 asparagine synthase-related protein [Rhodomicrobium lacus]